MSSMPESLLAPAISFPSRNFWDPTSGARLHIFTPAADPSLWRAYFRGLTATYRGYGLDRALGLDNFADGTTTAVCFVATDPDGRVIAGFRAHGPLRTAEQAHVLTEFAACPPSVATITRLVSDRIPFGVIELKGGWVDKSAPHRGELSNTLARGFIHVMNVLHVQFAFGTAATHAVTRWRTTGARPVPGLQPVPYPDDRYETTMLWWDQRTIDELGEPGQMRRVRSEAAVLHDHDVRALELSSVGGA